MSKWGRIPVAIVLLAAIGGIIVSENALLWASVTLFLAAFAAYEWARLAAFDDFGARIYAVLFIVIAGISQQWLFIDPASYPMLWGGVMLFWVCIAPCCLLTTRQFGKVATAAAGMVILYAAWHAAGELFARDPIMLLIGMVAVWLFDISAFVVGRLIGNTPLSQTVSPKKTMEGFLGGTFVVFAASLGYWWWNDNSDHIIPVVFSLAFVVVVLAALGDLFESWLKRRADTKDSGVLFGAHGGVLDRIDALLPVLPFIALLSPWIL